MSDPTPDELSAASRVLSAKGRRKGGLARAASMTPEQRREIARKAANARWKSPTARPFPLSGGVVRIRTPPEGTPKMPQPPNHPKPAFLWKDVVVPSHDLEDIPLVNKQRMLRVLTTSPLALADLLDAAMVILLSKQAREGLETVDRKALEQLQRAMDLCTPNLPNPYVDGQAVVVRDHEKPQYAVAHEMADETGRLSFVFGDGYSRYLPPWHYTVRPDDDGQAE